MEERARGSGGRRRSLLNTPIRPPKATPVPFPAADEQTTEATSAPTVIPHHEEQSTDLTGRPGTPSAVRRRIQHANRGARSLLGPDAYHVGDGIRPQTTDITLLMDPADRPTDHGDPEEILARLAGFKGVPVPPQVLVSADGPGVVVAEAPASAPAASAVDLETWDEPDTATPDGAPSRTRTDPFGLHLPTDEVDLLARAGGTIGEAFERSFFERDTQPIRGDYRVQRNPNMAAAVAVVAFGIVAVVALSVSAWIALSTPPPAVSSTGSEHALPLAPSIPPAPTHGASGPTRPAPEPEADPADPAAPPPEPTVADLPI